MSRYSETPIAFETGWLQETPLVVEGGPHFTIAQGAPAPSEVEGTTYPGMPYRVVLSVPAYAPQHLLGRVSNVEPITSGYTLYQGGLTDNGRGRPIFWISTDADRYVPPPSAAPYSQNLLEVSVNQGGNVSGSFSFTGKRGISLDPGASPPAGYIPEGATVQFTYSLGSDPSLFELLYLQVAYALSGDTGVVFPPLSDYRLHQCGTPRGMRFVHQSDMARLGGRYALVGPLMPGVSFSDPFYRSQLPSVWVGVPISGRMSRPRGWMRVFGVYASAHTYGGPYPQGGYELAVPHARDYPIAYAWVAPEQSQKVVRFLVDLRTARVRVFLRPSGAAGWSELGVGQTLTPIRCHQVVVYARQTTSAGYAASKPSELYQLEAFTHSPLYHGPYPQGGFPLATRVAPSKRAAVATILPADGDDTYLYFADLSAGRVRVFQKVAGHYEELAVGSAAPSKDVCQLVLWSDS